MKLDLKNILIGVLIIILIWQKISSNGNNGKPNPVNIEIPEKKGTTDTITLIDYRKDTVYLPSEKEYVEVDGGWKDKYLEAKDSVDRLNLYLEAIKIKETNVTIVDNDTLTVKGKVKTRGTLLGYNFDWTIHPTSFSYEPKIEYKRPNLSLGFGIEMGVPTIPTSSFLIKGDISFENSKGNQFSLGYDTESRVWLGFKKTIKIY